MSEMTFEPLMVEPAGVPRGRALVERADWAARAYAKYDIATVNRIVDAAASALATRAQEFARDAVSETGFGVVEHKVLKNIACSTGIVETYRGQDFVSPEIDEVNKIVADRESKGESVTSLPAYTSLVASLENEIKPGVHSRDVAAAYQKILNQVKILGEKDATGKVSNLTSFQAVDDARRMLGEAFRGQADEGYKAIGQTAQKKYYGLLSQIQKDFAGEEQSKLLTQYADTRPGLEVFGSKAGTKLVSLDKGALTQFANDPSKLPDYFFSTPKNYNALIEMVGSKELALKAAQQYAANQLAPKETSKQVGNWMTTNREFLSAVPEVKDAVIKYRTTLENGERAVANLGSGVKQLSAANAEILKTAQANASQQLKTGNLQATTARTEAGVITKESASAADNIWNFRAGPLKNVRDAIEGGNMEKWAAIAPVIERSPEAKKAVFDAVRQVTSEMGSSKGITQKFNENMRPALEKFGMLGRDEAESIAQQLAAIEAKRVPESEKLNKDELLNSLFYSIRQLQVKENIQPLVRQAQLLNKTINKLIEN
jgi:hypothetical protein